MPKFYDPSTVEQKWQKKWEEAGVYHVDFARAKKPLYCLVMFPYPSGARLHVGHWYQYGPTDSYARFLKMRGNDVFFPMGFDAFGLPAENYAVKTGVSPVRSTEENVRNMVAQFQRMGCIYDWSKALNTSDPSYYRWTQWLFLQMYKHGLAYKKEAPVNFCQQCQTVLAREQCQDGTCERCETQVVQKPLTQWFWKLTQYAERLLKGLDDLDWPEKTKLMQRNWIGKSQGATIKFPILKTKLQPNSKFQKSKPKDAVVEVFTTRPDTLFGALYLVLAPEHPLVLAIMTREQRGHVEAYVAATKMKNELQRTDLAKEKTGVFTGAYALHPATGEPLPVWVADYVLLTYGTGAVMAVPAHDERDHAFAKKYNLPVRVVVKPERAHYVIIEKSLPPACIGALETFGIVVVQKETPNWGKFFAVDVELQDEGKLIAFLEKNLLTSSADGGAWYADSLGSSDMVVYPKKTFHIVDAASRDAARQHGISLGIPEDQVNFSLFQNGPFTADGVCVASDFLTGLKTSDAKKRIIAWLEDEEKGREVTTYRLHDWLVSRQRYWGAPIPIVYDPEGNPHPIPEKHLPWLLPTDVEFKPTGESPLKHSKEFRERTEKLFGKGWTPEYDTMDTFVCSSFYYLRFLAHENPKSEIRNPDSARAHGRVAKSETGTLPKGVSDFDIRASDFRLIDPSIERQWMPVQTYIGGPEHACMHLIYARFVMMALKDFGFVSNDEPFKKLVHQGLITNKGAKMSKSKGNVVSPDPYVAKYGSDVFRMYLMFMGPYTDGGDWSETGIRGIERFVQRVWLLVTRYSLLDQKKKDGPDVVRKLHETIKRVTENLEQFHFNTAISALMEFLNLLEGQERVSGEVLKIFTTLLAPFAPHLAEELWERLISKDEPTHSTDSTGSPQASSRSGPESSGPRAGQASQRSNEQCAFVVTQSWPAYDPAILKAQTVTIVVQVNGKVRANIEVSADTTKDGVIAAAKKEENVAKYLQNQTTKKEVYVAGKLVNFVL